MYYFYRGDLHIKKGDNLMKRLISCILILAIFIVSFTITFADKPVNKVRLLENGKGENYQVVNLIIDGKTVESKDVPPIIYTLDGKGRTLVPLRMIIEYLGDKLDAEIEWDGDRREAKIKTEEKEIVLAIDNPYATVNGVEKRLPDDISAKLLAIRNKDGAIGRTMIPIRFFEGEFGIDIDWDPASATASLKTPEKPKTNPGIPPENSGSDVLRPDIPRKDFDAVVTDIKVKVNGSTPQIRIKVSGEADYNNFEWEKDSKRLLIIDLDNTRFDLRDKNRLEINKTLDIKTGSKTVSRIRASQFQAPTGEKPNDSFIARVVAELDDSVDYEIAFESETGELIIDFINHVYNIKKEIINLKEVVVIEGDTFDDYEMIKLNDPERIAVDIRGATLHNKFKDRTINVEGRTVKSIRTCQHAPEKGISDVKTARVVIDLRKDIGHDGVYAEIRDNKLLVHMEGKPFRAIRYEETGWTTSKFTLKGLVATKYDVEFQSTSGIVSITVPKRDIDLEPISLDIDDHIMKTIDIEEDRNSYNIRLKLQDSVEHKLLSPERGQDLILEFNNKDAKYREILVVIDPGHGGPDPGTISVNLNMRESEVVLDISLKLNKLLTEAGFRTYMTRTDDSDNGSKLGLQDRTDIANVLDANLFVSIHANSYTNNSTSGIETFYSPRDADGKKLAGIIQSKLINDLKMIDRGAKSANYFVLEHTTMPSVLVETGFLSNPSDEAKLATDKYREQVAGSMFKAIIEYLESTR